jgi:hypothetical protein
MTNPSQDDKTDAEQRNDYKDWLPGALVPLFYLSLLAGGFWLIIWHFDALDDRRVQIAVWGIMVAALGLAVFLFVRQWKSGIYTDKRNWLDMTGFQWRKRIARDWDDTDRR